MEKKYDHYGRREPEIIYLATPDRRILCALNGVDPSSVNVTHNALDVDNLTFDVYQYTDDEPSAGYEWIEELMQLYVDGTWFVINRPPTTEHDGNKEYKSIDCDSYEITLQQYDLEGFRVNTGTSGSLEMMYRDKIGASGYFQCKFQDKETPDLSFSDNIFSFANVPRWKVGYVDEALSEDYGIALSDEINAFDEDTIDVYAFLTQEVSKAYKCIPVFNTKEYLVDFYRVESMGLDTNIYLGFHNVENNITISRDNELTTCYTVYGGDDLNIDYVNPRSSTIYDITYFCREPYMPEALAEKYLAWVDYQESRREEYIELSRQYNTYLTTISELMDRVPEDGVTNDWSDFEVTDLQNAYNNYIAIIVSLEELYVDGDGHFDLEALKESPDWPLYESIMNYILPKIVAALQGKNESPKADDNDLHLPEYGQGNLLQNVNPVVIDDTWTAIGVQANASTIEITDSPCYGATRGIRVTLSSGDFSQRFGYSQRKIVVNNGTNYTLSAFVRPIGNVSEMYLEYGQSNSNRTAQSFSLQGDGWQRVFATFQAPAQMIDVGFSVIIESANSGFEMCGMQLEIGTAPTQFGFYIMDESVINGFETDWKLYGTTELTIKLEQYDKEIKVLEKRGICDDDWGEWIDVSEDYYNQMRQMYHDYKRLYNECKAALDERQAEVDEATKHLNEIGEKRQKIADDCEMENFGQVQSQYVDFTQDEIDLIKSFYVHKDYTNENIIYTSINTESEIVDIEYKLYKDAVDILYAESHPQYTYEDEVENLLALSEFDDFSNEIELWNYIRIATRPDEFVKLRLISMEYNPCIWDNNFMITFSNMIKYKYKRNDFVTILDNFEGSSKNSGGVIGSPTSIDTYTITADVIKSLLKYPSFGNTLVAGSIGAASGQIDYLVTKSLDSERITTKFLEAVEANFNRIFTDYISSEVADFGKVVTDFLMAGNIITDDINAATGTFTNYLTGVKIMGDLIEAHTLIADKLIIRGYDEDGNLEHSIIYALNNEGNVEATDVPASELENYQLNGKIIIAESITANKINVQDLWVNGVATLLNANIGNAWIDDLTALTSNIGDWHIEGSVISSDSYNSKLVGGIVESVNYKTDADGNVMSGCQIDLINYTWDSPNFKIDKDGNVEIKGTLVAGSKVPTSSIVGSNGESLEDILDTLGGTIELHSKEMAFVEENAKLSPDSVTVTAVATGCTVERWLLDDVENISYVSDDKLSITIPSAYMADKTSVAVEAQNEDGSIFDIFTIYKLKSADAAITVALRSSQGQIFQKNDNTILNTTVTATVYRGATAITPNSYEWYLQADNASGWEKQSNTSRSITIPLSLFLSRARLRCVVDV